jgi:hypothetical protein
LVGGHLHRRRQARTNPWLAVVKPEGRRGGSEWSWGALRRYCRLPGGLSHAPTGRGGHSSIASGDSVAAYAASFDSTIQT